MRCFMHVYKHIYNTNVYFYFINLCYLTTRSFGLFFLLSFILTFSSAVSVQKHCINKYFKSLPLFSQFLSLQNSFYLSNINK